MAMRSVTSQKLKLYLPTGLHTYQTVCRTVVGGTTPGPDTLQGHWSNQGVDAVARIVVVATGGTFTLTFEGQTTSALAYNAGAGDVQSALGSLSTVDTGNVFVTGDNAGPFLVYFQGGLAATPVPALTGSGASLTGPSHSLTVTAYQPGEYDGTHVVALGNQGHDSGVVIVRRIANNPSAGASGGYQAKRTGTIGVVTPATTTEMRTRNYWRGNAQNGVHPRNG